MGTPGVVNPFLATAEQAGHAFSFLFARPGEIELEPWPLPTMEQQGFELSGDPEYAGRILWKSDDEREVVGIERCGPCVLRGTHGGEMLVYLAGRVEVRPPGGTPYEIKAGDVLRFPKGMEDEWHIVETTVKVFHMRIETAISF